MKITKKILFVLAIISVAFCRFALADIPSRIDSIVKRDSLKKVNFGICIVDAKTGVVAYGYNPAAPRVPASNMKIIITAAALKYLGPDFEYVTKVGLLGDTLVITGSGDPLLADKTTDAKYGRQTGWILKDIADTLAKNNVTAVKDIVVDSSVFDDQRVHPHWPKDELNKWYACEVSGLNYNGNCVEIIASTVAGRIELIVDPPTRYVDVINKCQTAPKGHDTVWCSRQQGSNVITVLGKCYKDCQPVRVAVERPAAFFGFLLAEQLAASGIKVEGQFVEKRLDDISALKDLTAYKTNLWDVLERCNKDSFGLAAESLLKTVVAHPELGGKGGSWHAGQEVISQYLRDLNVPDDQFVIDDGSGLSKDNRLTANALTTVLLDIYRSPYWEHYKDTLAVGGVDGTVSKYFKNKKYKARIFGKTGYIDGVKCFSGLCRTDAGDYIFSILANNANGSTREAINEIAQAVIDESE